MSRSSGTWTKGQGGRPKGARAVKTQRIATQLVRDGKITPLEVMVATMRELWDAAMIETQVPERRSLCVQACACAEKAAPYMHARLASTTVNVRQIKDVRDLSTDELVALLASAGADPAEDSAEPADPVH